MIRIFKDKIKVVTNHDSRITNHGFYMKKILFILSLTLFSLPAIHAGEYTAGIAVGAPTGITGTWWINEKRGISASLDSFVIHLFTIDHLWRWSSLPKQFKDYEENIDFVYIGVGGSIRTGKGGRIGARMPLGIIKDYSLFRIPLRSSIELSPVLRLSPSFGFNAEGKISLEYRF